MLPAPSVALSVRSLPSEGFKIVWPVCGEPDGRECRRRIALRPTEILRQAYHRACTACPRPGQC